MTAKPTADNGSRARSRAENGSTPSTAMSPLLVLLLAALLVVLAACGSEDAVDTANEAADEATETDASGTEDAEAAEEFVIEAEEEEAADDAEEAMEEEAMEDEDAMGDGEAFASPSTTTTVASGDTATAERSASPSGGFFGTEDGESAEDEVDANFRDYGIRSFVETSRDPLSTFALDVDTGSYTVARAMLEQGQVPPPESVRVEEYVNSFDYDYPAPSEGLTVVADGGPSPYNADNVILRLGVQAEEIAGGDRPPAALTFVVDTSGSMDRPNRLGLVIDSLSGLTRELDGDDTVAIVTYSDDGVVVLEPTPVADRDVILDAINSLQTTGSTNLQAGLEVGYSVANSHYRRDGVNRVILASDGIANVGLVDPDGLASMIRDDADEGIQLVTIGVGMDGFNDVMMEQLADQGDGFYAYVDELSEAQRLFGDELVSTLVTAAIDGKIQVEFDSDSVEAYRLIGFENRAVLDDDFRNDDVDAGELGAGHQVTAIYELTLVDGLNDRDRLGTAQLRWEDPEERSVRETRLELSAAMLDDRWADTSDDFRLAVTVASFAEVLRDSPHRGDVTLSQIEAEAESLAGSSGRVAEFVELVRIARDRT